MQDKRRGFTLAELLIVVAIIAVLVAISIPVFNKKLEKSRETENRQLNDTLKWMHDTIWELLHSQKNSSQCEAAAARIDSFT